MPHGLKGRVAAYMAGVSKKLAPKNAKDAHMTLTKSSLLTPMAPPRRARTFPMAGAGFMAGARATTVLDAGAICEAEAEAMVRASAAMRSFMIMMKVQEPD